MSTWAPHPISVRELEALGDRMRCDFTSNARRGFLNRWDSCDVQAAPGSGKTTLVVAKLVHLSQHWPFARQGVCVLSHTNVAREEIEGKIAHIPEAGRVLAYPSFIGTLTSFFHTFLALPLLRGLRWPMCRVDDDVFAACCRARLGGKPTLQKTPKANRRRLAAWAAKLTLAPDFELGDGGPPASVKVGEQQDLFSRSTSTRRELEEVKAEICADGIYRYDDMIILAARALELAPHIANRLAARFPYVLVDEAQDTCPRHLELIDQIFGDGRACLQRIGDCNQAIIGATDSDAAWRPAEGYVDLGESLRFGSQIAEFASRLTCARRQVIVGEGANSRPTHVMLIAEGAERRVGPRFAELIASELARAGDLDVWAVAFTHNHSDSDKALRLGTYFDSYKPPQRSSDGEPTVLGALQKELGRLGPDARFDLGPVVDTYARQLRLLLANCEQSTVLISIRNIWKWLDEARLGSARATRAVLRRIVRSRGVMDAGEWKSISDELRLALHPRLPYDHPSLAVSSMLAYVDSGGVGRLDTASTDTRSVVYDVEKRRVRVRLGTIASVKGRTHDATLIVQTTNGSVKDVRSALQVATGDMRPLEKPQVRRAVMNVFVGATRPRRLLCLALPMDDAVKELRPKLEKLGLVILEVQ